MKNLKYSLVAVLCVVGLTPARPALAAADPVSCTDAIAGAQTLNASDLWRGAGECTEAGKMRETNFLLITGQIRAMTDMNVLEPATDNDREGVTELYSVLYYRAGGSGFSEIYRDANNYEQLTKALDDWAPTFNADYQPGWKFKALTDSTDYDRMMACQKAFRMSKLRWYASLVQNDEYYELSQQQQALREKNPGAMKAGSEVAKQYSALAEKIKVVSSKMPSPTDTPKACEGIKPR
jgi:hypothetical protein